MSLAEYTNGFRGYHRMLTHVHRAGPAAQGFRTDLWTLPRVAEVIKRLTGVRHHPWACVADPAAVVTPTAGSARAGTGRQSHRTVEDAALSAAKKTPDDNTARGSSSKTVSRRGDGRPRLRWSRPAAPAASKRRLRRHTCRTVTANATATSRPVTRRATKAFSNPIRGASFRLIVSVSPVVMG
jgi:hypothetical protein